MTQWFRRELSVGVFVLGALAVAAVGILAIGRESRLFSPKVEYRTSFQNITGLSEGAPVRLAGVQVGTVRRVEFPEDLSRKEIQVVMNVDRTFQDRIRQDSRALLRPLSYLSIEKYIEITTGGPDVAPIEPGGHITADVTELERMQVAGQNIAENIQEITTLMKGLLHAVTEGEGLISDLFYDQEFGQETRTNLEETAGSLRRITASIEKREGLVGRLLMDREFADRELGGIESTTSRLDALLGGLERREGAIGDLLAADGKAMRAIEDFSEVVADLREATRGLREETGLVGKLLHDDEYAKDLLERVHAVASNLESITEKLDRGQGTLGMMLNDPEVYQGLEDVVGGIRNSRVMTALIRKYGRKGAKERVEKALEEIERQEKEGAGGEGEP